MDEAQTRKELIDPQLKEAGWIKDYIKEEVNSVKSVFIKKHYVLFSGTVEKGVDRFIDYLLLAEDNSLLAIIEVKRSSVSFYKGRIQAETYQKDIKNQTGKKIPLFLTNGYDWMFVDEDNNERRVSGIFTRDDLERRREMYKNKRNPGDINLDQRIVDREKSRIIVKKLAEHFQKGHRKALVNMATGTGKTRVAMALIDLLKKADYIKNILFVVDRISLADQAKSAFSEFFDEPLTELNVEKDFSSTKRFYVSTVQTLMGEKGAAFKKFSPGFFDLIVFDEAHRSYYGKPDVMIKYFDAMHLGLTATPSKEESRNTFALFDCEYQKPTVKYDYYDAVEDKILAPYTADVIETKVLSLGIEGKKLSSDLQDALRRQEEDPNYLELPGSAFERVFMDEKTNELIIREVIHRCYKSADGRPCKTIFFCAGIRHAQELKRLFTKLDPEISREVSVITSDMARYMDEVKRFKLDSSPRIALSVGILDTGIDIPEICNLVFVKPVFSPIRFWQMLGRGTRNLDACKHKEWLPKDENEFSIKKDFLIIDFKFGDHSNVKFHKLEEETEPKPSPVGIKTKIFLQRVDLLKKNLNKDQKEVIGEKIIATINSLDKKSFMIREKLPIIKKVISKKFDLKKHIKELKEEIAPLLILSPGEDSKISSFVFKIEKLYFALIESNQDLVDKTEEYVKNKLKNILLKQNLEEVKNKTNEIKKVFQERFWEELTIENIDFLVKEIAPLMIHYYPESKRILQINAPDWLIGEEKVKLEIKKENTVFKKFLADNPLIKKIKDGEGVTSKELLKIEKSLQKLNSYVSIENIQKIERIDFLVFLHKIIGLTNEYDPKELIKREFDKYVVDRNYTSKQLEFLSLLKKVFAERKHIELKDFAKHPLNQERPFEVDELKELVVVCNKIKMK